MPQGIADQCAACPVWEGECPACGTFFFARSGKRYAVRPTDGSRFTRNADGLIVHPRTGHVLRFEELPNVRRLADA